MPLVGDPPAIAAASIAEIRGGDLSAVAALHARAEVLSLGVAPAARERGIARALMHAAIDWVSRRDLRALYLEVAEDNTAALRLYRALGFAPVGRRPGYYARPQTEAVDALTLRRAIVPAAFAGGSSESVLDGLATGRDRGPPLCGALAEAPAAGRLP